MLRRTPVKAKPKSKTADMRKFHGEVAKLPCLVCGAWPVEVHHVRHDGRKGISKDDTLVVPLCAEHHRTGRGKNDDPPAEPAAVAQPARRAAGHPRTAVRQARSTRPVPPLPKALHAAL